VSSRSRAGRLPVAVIADLEQARRQQQVVAEVSASPHVRQGEVAALARLLTERVAQLLEVERVSVWLFNARADELVCEDLYVRSQHAHSQGAVLRRSQFEAEFDALLTSKFVDAHDALVDPRTKGYADGYLLPNGITSMLDAVVRTGEELIGLVCLEHVGQPHHWDPSEIVLASQLGDQVALAVAMARMKAVAEALIERDQDLQTANARLQQGLEATQQALRSAEQLAQLGRLVTGVAHDVNTPIGSAVLLADSQLAQTRDMQAVVATGRVQRSALERYFAEHMKSGELVLRSLRRAAALIAALKTITADQSSGERRRFSLRGLVDDTLAVLDPSLRRQACAIEVQVDVPDTLQIDGYPGPLAQVLGNLITNAQVHAFDGRSRGCLRIVAAQEAADWVTLRVMDDGHGIAPALRERVFERFFTTRRESGGSGLGLDLVRELMQEPIGGDVALEDHGAGCCVRLRLPMVAP
jgi:signal transduction histidine kinase